MAAYLDHPDPASAILFALSGPARGSRIEVPPDGLLFGRAAGSAGRLGDDSALSRWHARLDFADGALTIADLGSTNGIFVNGQRISGRQPIRPGDFVTLGTSNLQVLAAPTTAPAQPPPAAAPYPAAPPPAWPAS